jgi:DNA-binding FrmR family transcriptional regulator
MGEHEVGEIMRSLGRIEGQIVGIQVMRDNVQTIKHEVAQVKADISTLRREVKALQAEGCVIGVSNRAFLSGLDNRLKFLEGVWRKAVLVMAGVGVGAVGVKESITAILRAIGGV